MLDILELTELAGPETGRQLPGDMGRRTVGRGVECDLFIVRLEERIVTRHEPQLAVGRDEGRDRFLARDPFGQ